MGNSVNPRPVAPILKQVEALGIAPRSPLWQLFQDLALRSDKTQTNLGELRKEANVTGRTEQLSVTLQNVTSAGQLSTTDAIAADGTGNPLTGGRRGFVALDSNNRLSSSIHNTTVNVSNAPNASTSMANDGSSTTINISAVTQQFPFGTVSYNSASYNPGTFNTWFFYMDDPTFAGGAAPFIGTLTPVDQAASEGRIPVGVITTVGGSAKTGGGYTGGTTAGGGGGRGINLI